MTSYTIRLAGQDEPVTVNFPLGYVLGRAQSAAAAAQTSARFAEEFSGPAYADIAAGEAATTEGQFFRVPVGTTPETYTRYQRTASGSVEAAPLATTLELDTVSKRISTATAALYATSAGIFGGEQLQTMLDDHVERLPAPAANAALRLAWGKVDCTAAIWLTRGVNGFRGCVLEGTNAANNGVESHIGDTLEFENNTDKQGGAVNIQGGRNVRISNLTIIDNSMIALRSVASTFDITNPDAAFDNVLTAGGSTPGKRYAPWAGIAIDPRSGDDPGVGERVPTTVYPTDLYDPQPGGDDYGMALSSRMSCSGLQITGFEVAVVNHPNPALGNGDWMDTPERLTIDGNKYAFSWGDDQNRQPVLSALIRNAHTAVTSNAHGEQSGHLPARMDFGISAFCYQLFDMNDPANNDHEFVITAESLVRFGAIRNGSKTNPGSIAIKGKANFWGDATRGVPAKMVEGGPARSPIVFDKFMADMFGAQYYEPHNVIMSGTVLKQREAQDSPYLRLAYNASLGGAVFNPIKNPNTQIINYSPVAIADGATQEARLSKPDYPHVGRDTGVPFHLKRTTHGLCKTEFALHNHATGSRYYLLPAPQLSSISRTGTAVSFTNARINGDDITQNRFLTNGSLWLHYDSGIIAAVRSTDTSTNAQTIELLNGYKGSDLIDSSIDFESGNWYCFPTNLFATPRRLIGDFTSGSDTITNVRSVGLNGTHETDFGLAVGDRFATEWCEEVGLISPAASSDSSITEIDTSADTFKLGRNAARTQSDVPMDVWFLAPPADEASR